MPGVLRARVLRDALAFGFGQVHGFRFASVLGQMGLPRDALGGSLAGFNVGVEVGQAALVLAVVLLFALLDRRSGAWHRRVVVGGSLAIAVAGRYWFVARLLGR